MGAFCVFGVSKKMALRMAEARAIATGADRKFPQEELFQRIQKEAELIFNTQGRLAQCSPEFDAPSFCREWIDVAERTKQIRMPKIMMRGEKKDKKGKVVIRKKAPVTTWVPCEI